MTMTTIRLQVTYEEWLIGNKLLMTKDNYESKKKKTSIWYNQ